MLIESRHPQKNLSGKYKKEKIPLAVGFGIIGRAGTGLHRLRYPSWETAADTKIYFLVANNFI